MFIKSLITTILLVTNYASATNNETECQDSGKQFEKSPSVEKVIEDKNLNFIEISSNIIKPQVKFLEHKEPISSYFTYHVFNPETGLLEKKTFS